jgi:acid phosphatase
MVIVEENRNRSQVIGASNMPYLNRLASEYGDTTSWDGVGHPSLPNYLGLISGSTQGVTSDTSGEFPGVNNLAQQLTEAKIPWRAYMEDMPSSGYTGVEAYPYAKKHNPFAFFPSANGANVEPGWRYQTDLSGGALPSFVWYTPNLCNDGHDCGNSTVDAKLKALLEPLMASKWYAENGTVIITYDEDEGEGKIATVVISSRAKGRVESTAGNHYGTLATIEDLYKLPLLGAAVGAQTLLPLLGKAP